MKTISIVTPCFNEQDNVEECVNAIKNAMSAHSNYAYEHIFIDNASTDNTLELLRGIALRDPHVKVIANSRNFGHIRSPYYGLLQAKGDAVISFVADLQDPVSLIPEFIKKWEEGFKTVVGTKRSSEESSVMFSIRKFYYRTVNKLSNVDLIDNFTGFGLYDREVVDHLRSMNDPYPYFRGLIAEIGLKIFQIQVALQQRIASGRL